MSVSLSTQKYIDDARTLFEKADKTIAQRIGDNERTWFEIDNEGFLELALQDIKDPAIAIVEATCVPIRVSKIATKFFKSQYPSDDLSFFENDLKIIQTAADDVEFPDPEKGDIFEQASAVMQASERILNFVIENT